VHYGKIEPLNDREAASATGQQIEVLYASAGREIEIATRSKGAAGGRHFLLAFTSKGLAAGSIFSASSHERLG